MQEVRKYPRVAYRLAVDLYPGAASEAFHCHTLNIGLGGLFAEGVAGVRTGDNLKVALDRHEQAALELDGQVTRVTATGAGLAFYGNGPAALATLRELIEPDWDGHDLLEGVMKVGPRYEGSGLADWMRLTSLLSDWQRLHHQSQRDAPRPEGGSETPD